MIHGIGSTSQMCTRALHTALLSLDRTTWPRTQQAQKGHLSMMISRDLKLIQETVGTLEYRYSTRRAARVTTP